jgi:hypothetical protein
VKRTDKKNTFTRHRLINSIQTFFEDSKREVDINLILDPTILDMHMMYPAKRFFCIKQYELR